MPLVSIILSTFNRVDFLKFVSIPSILRQDYKNWELIIVDDASTDGTSDFIKDLKNKIKNLIYIKFEKNKGYGATINEGVKIAKGDYIALIDADDGWLSAKLRKQIEFMGKENLLASTCLVFQYDILKNKIQGVTSVGLPGFIARKNFFEIICPLSEELKGIEDLEFFLKLELAKIHNKIPSNSFRILNEPLVWYVRHPKAVSFYEGISKSKVLIERYTSFLNKYSNISFNLEDKILKEFFARNYLKLAMYDLIVGEKEQAIKSLDISLKLQFSFIALFLRIFNFLPKKVYFLFKKFWRDFLVEGLIYKKNLLKYRKYYKLNLVEIKQLIKDTQKVNLKM
jgi:glycosyltransferase involved in cell wall biosynthesis